MGGHGLLHARGEHVADLIRGMGVMPHYLKLNQDGTPMHPLYVGYAEEPKPWG